MAQLGSAPASKFLQRLPYLSEASNPIPQLEQQTGISSTRVSPKNLRIVEKVRKPRREKIILKRQAGGECEEEGGGGGRGLMGLAMQGREELQRQEGRV